MISFWEEEEAEGVIHQEVKPTKFLDAGVDSFLQAFEVPNIDSPEPDHFGALAGSCDVLGHAFGLLNIAPDYACVGAEVDECSHLGGAYAAVPAGAEDDFVV